MRHLCVAFLCLAGLTGPALAQSCPGNPDAIGTSRVITVDPKELPHIGTMQYHASIPLKDHEVVLTFDDGPLPPYTERILAILKANCAKATYFLVGQMAQSYPWAVREIYNDGNTIGTHSQHHPFHFDSMGLPRIESEVDGGIASVTKAVGDPRAVSPFFRIPGLARGKQVETFLASQDIAVWSADEVADDWHRGITPEQIVHLAISRIDAKHHRGVLLLHDIHPATAMALPTLLKELKQRGYHIVQVVAPGVRPKSVPVLPEPPVFARREAWPRPLEAHQATTHAIMARQHHDKKLAHKRALHARHEAGVLTIRKVN
jgi:peptidoglycan/xylan/chitin deacetylase (PgdA/CDA1 family)